MIEEKVLEEQRIIIEIRDMYKMYSDSFETFLSSDYDEAMKQLRRAEKEATKSLDKTEEIKRLYTRLASIEFEVHKFEDRWRDLKMYQRFLYYVSPISWRKEYDYINSLETQGQHSSTTFLKKYRLTSQGQVPSLEELVDDYLKDISEEQEPMLYFQKPIELKKIFRFMEIQNLNCLLHTEEMAIPMENMKETMQRAKKKYESEAQAMTDIIDNISGSIT